MIQIQNFQKNYPGFHLDISLTVPRGHVTGLVGRNGAGKSTTIKTILGLVKPDAGSVTVLGKNSYALTETDKQDLGIALSESGFSNYIDGNSIIKILRNMYKGFDESYFRRLANEQGLPMDRQIKEFSTGMKAKLRVLVAISHRAKLLILDEPTAGLDVLARNEILDLLRDYIAEDDSRSILITSHISSDLEGLCDDIYMIHDGKILLHEDTDILLGNYALLKISDEDYSTLDKTHILAVKQSSFGYTCLTNAKQYYLENFPKIVIENSGIDDLIVMLLDKKRR